MDFFCGADIACLLNFLGLLGDLESLGRYLRRTKLGTRITMDIDFVKKDRVRLARCEDITPRPGMISDSMIVFDDPSLISAKLAPFLVTLPHVRVAAPVIQNFAMGSKIEILYGIDYVSFNALKPFTFIAGGPFQGPYDVIVDDIWAKTDGGHHVGPVGLGPVATGQREWPFDGGCRFQAYRPIPQAAGVCSRDAAVSEPSSMP